MVIWISINLFSAGVDTPRSDHRGRCVRGTAMRIGNGIAACQVEQGYAGSPVDRAPSDFTGGSEGKSPACCRGARAVRTTPATDQQRWAVAVGGLRQPIGCLRPLEQLCWGRFSAMACCIASNSQCWVRSRSTGLSRGSLLFIIALSRNASRVAIGPRRFATLAGHRCHRRLSAEIQTPPVLRRLPGAETVPGCLQVAFPGYRNRARSMTWQAPLRSVTPRWWPVA